MNLSDYDEIASRARPESPFSNGTEGEEWMEGPRDEHGRYSMADQYHCIEFRAPGDGGGEPRPKPEPPQMDGLFERPERRTRMWVQPVDEPALAEVSR